MTAIRKKMLAVAKKIGVTAHMVDAHVEVWLRHNNKQYECPWLNMSGPFTECDSHKKLCEAMFPRTVGCLGKWGCPCLGAYTLKYVIRRAKEALK